MFVTAQLPQAIAPRAAVAPIAARRRSLKDEKIEGAWRRLILDFRATPAVLDFVNGAELARYSQAGVVTPDHTIRTKNWPLLVPAPADGKLDDFKRAARGAVAAFIENYQAYFARNNARVGGIKKHARSAAARRAGAGPRPVRPRALARRTRASPPTSPSAAIETITDAEAIGRFESISEADMFDMEYWSLEQAKLGARQGTAARRPDRGDHRRRRHHRRRDREGVRRGRRRGRAARYRRGRRAGQGQGDRRRGARGRAAT